MDHLFADPELGLVVVDGDRLASCDARNAQPPRDHGRVARGSAPCGEDALRMQDAMDVIGGGLQADQDHRLLLVAAHRLGLVRIERRESRGRSRRCIQAVR